MVEFGSDKDRKYYLDEDPAHLAFKKILDGVKEKITVLDYVPGVL